MLKLSWRVEVPVCGLYLVTAYKLDWVSDWTIFNVAVASAFSFSTITTFMTYFSVNKFDELCFQQAFGFQAAVADDVIPH